MSLNPALLACGSGRWDCEGSCKTAGLKVVFIIRGKVPQPTLQDSYEAMQLMCVLGAANNGCHMISMDKPQEVLGSTFLDPKATVES